MSTIWRFFILGAVLAALLACGQSTERAPVNGPQEAALPPHVFLMIIDDLGIDAGPCHNDGTATPPLLPKLEARCSQSLVYDRAYSYPYCSATRASLMTGRHSFQTGVQDVTYSARKLPLSEITLPEALKASNPAIRTAGFGKWHLADDQNGDLTNPNQQGFDHFAGTPRQHYTYQYYDYLWTVNGQNQSVEQTYKTTKIVDSVIDDFAAHKDAQGFYHISFTNPHLPFHRPPDHLHSQDLPLGDPPSRVSAPPVGGGQYLANTRTPALDPYYFAMLEALDTEMNRLIETVSALSARPVVFIILGDNGSAAEVYRGDTAAGYRAKASLYDGGVRVPMMMVHSDGRGPKQRTDALVSTVDMFDTVAALMGATLAVPPSAHQRSGKNIAPTSARETITGHDMIYLEAGHERRLPFAFAAIDKAGLKLIVTETQRPPRFYTGLMELYDTQADPGERQNLLETPCAVNLAAVQDMVDFLAETRASMETPFGGGFDKTAYDQQIARWRDDCAE